MDYHFIRTGALHPPTVSLSVAAAHIAPYAPYIQSYPPPSSVVLITLLILTVALQLLVSSPVLYKIPHHNFQFLINTLALQSILPYIDSAKGNNIRSTIRTKKENLRDKTLTKI